MQKIHVPLFDLQKTLECGQFFRYKRTRDWYYINSRDLLFKVQQQGDKLIFYGVNKKFIKQFFRLGDPYEKIIKEISVDEHIKKAIKNNIGLRLIRQDPWECLISYICSQNSNIPRIQNKLNFLAKTFGQQIRLDNFETYTFPAPGQLNNLNKIKSCKVGYRAKYIFEANKIDPKPLATLRIKHYNEAKEFLLNIHGVGEKVADCVCMFSLDKLEAFPVDVWIKRVMQENYFNNQDISNKKLREFAEQRFGKYASYANQFLYHSRRSK